MANHYHSWLTKITLSKTVISIILNVETWKVSYGIETKGTFSEL